MGTPTETSADAPASTRPRLSDHPDYAADVAEYRRIMRDPSFQATANWTLPTGDIASDEVMLLADFEEKLDDMIAVSNETLDSMSYCQLPRADE